MMGNNWVHIKDKNGWQPIHEAARKGRIEVLQFILDVSGSDKIINSISNFGRGRSPLRIAIDNLGEDHNACLYLKSQGALNIGPEPRPEL